MGEATAGPDHLRASTQAGPARRHRAPAQTCARAGPARRHRVRARAQAGPALRHRRAARTCPRAGPACARAATRGGFAQVAPPPRAVSARRPGPRATRPRALRLRARLQSRLRAPSAQTLAGRPERARRAHARPARRAQGSDVRADPARTGRVVPGPGSDMRLPSRTPEQTRPACHCRRKCLRRCRKQTAGRSDGSGGAVAEADDATPPPRRRRRRRKGVGGVGGDDRRSDGGGGAVAEADAATPLPRRRRRRRKGWGVGLMGEATSSARRARRASCGLKIKSLVRSRADVCSRVRRRAGPGRRRRAATAATAAAAAGRGWGGGGG